MSMQMASTAVPAGIVADDLTGATDSAVQFAHDGWAARLALTVPSANSTSPGAVVAVVTDARAMPAAAARAATEHAVADLLHAGVRRLFVKIDSTMRGSVIDQINGALDGWSAKHPEAVAIVCSAYPAMGRTVESGHILVNGEGVHTTAVGTDPVTPVVTSDLAELLPGSAQVSLGAPTAAGNAAILREAISDGTRVVSVNAATDADLALLAQAIELLGERAIPVGAAGLAVATSQVWSAPRTTERSSTEARRVVVVVSSLHDVSRTQATYLREHFAVDRVRMLAPTLHDALHPDSAAAWVTSQLAGNDPLPELVIIVSPSERPTPSAAHDRPASELVADSLAIITDLVLAEGPVDALMLLGGEGARAVLSRLGATSLLVQDAIREGIPLGVIEGGSANGLTIVTKAGGFGAPGAVYDIVTDLIDPDGSAQHEGHAL